MSRSSSTACVLLFARDPVAEGQAKRLRRGGRLFDLGLRRIVKAVAGLPGVGLVVAGSEAGDVPQRGTGFGERLRNAFQDAAALGFDRIVAVPIDTPQIDRRHLREALRHLRSHDVVLGKSPDGGVYLIGARGGVSRLFEGVRWQSATVAADLLANAPGAVVLQDRLADVDDASDLEALSSRPNLDPELRGVLACLLCTPPAGRPDSQAKREAGFAGRLSIPRAPPPATPLH